jgi:stage IV sporulation protein FB
MFFDTPPTRFDLQFRLWRFPVRVNPFFWLAMAILGRFEFQDRFDYGLLWIACGFASILWHELGHAVAIYRYGSPAKIVLHAFGGLAIPSYPSTSPWRRMMIAAAGPLASFALLGLVWGTDELFGWSAASGYLRKAAGHLIFINLFWTLINLLPVWPLDGSRILREVFVVRRHRQPDYVTQKVSMVVALAVGGLTLFVNFGPRDFVLSVVKDWPLWLILLIPGPVMAFFLFFAAYQSYELMRQLRRPRLYVEDDDRLPWERR